MRRVTVLLGLALLAYPVSPSAAHVGERAAAESQPGMFGQSPVPAVARQAQEAPEVASPRAQCGPGSKPEPGLQGRVAKADVDSGAAAEGYWCNVERVGQIGATGGFKTLRYVDENGHECAYYDTTLLFPTNTLNLSLQPTGVAVLDMSNPAEPKRTDSLLTPAMQSPHESVNISVQRGLLAAVMGNPAFAPGVVDVYDISKDCRRPVLLASSPVGWLGHESGMAPDGRTFYATSIGTGQTTAVDLTNPQVPLPLWVGQYDSHGMTVSDDGNRGYLAAGSGLIILDLSEIQARKPDPQVREISRLVWPNMTIPQVAHPVTIKGKPYLVEVDEYSASAGGSGSVTGHGPVVGAARIIDISDETKPRVVSQIRLEVHQPEHRAAIAGDYGARNPTQGYAAHYCNVPQRVEPGIFACSMILSGLRVFDIRDPEHPKEIAYHVAPPSHVSETGGPVIDERANWAMSQPAFAPERKEIWYSDGTSGFWTLRLTNNAWPTAEVRSASCADHRGFSSAGIRRSGRGVSLRFARRAELPVRIDVFRVSDGRRVIRERRVASFRNRASAVTWRTRLGAGYYFVRFTMLKNGRAYDTRRVVMERTVNGNWVQRPDHFRRDSCGLLGKFKLERPVFGGSGNAGLTAAYRLTQPSQVSVAVERAGRVVKRFAPVNQPANKTLRVRLPARGLSRGQYTIRLTVTRGEDQISAKLVARKL